MIMLIINIMVKGIFLTIYEILNLTQLLLIKNDEKSSNQENVQKLINYTGKTQDQYWNCKKSI